MTQLQKKKKTRQDWLEDHNHDHDALYLKHNPVHFARPMYVKRSYYKKHEWPKEKEEEEQYCTHTQ